MKVTEYRKSVMTGYAEMVNSLDLGRYSERRALEALKLVLTETLRQLDALTKLDQDLFDMASNVNEIVE